MSHKSLHKLLKAKKRAKKLKKKMNILKAMPTRNGLEISKRFMVETNMGLGIAGREFKKKAKATASVQ